jgi:alkaline phosphatase D
MDDNLRVWRSFSLGSLVDLVMLDTRQYDRSITDLYWNTDYVHEISNDAGRSMMGSRQEHWFYEKLIASKERKATWRVIGSQTVFSRINESVAYGNVNPLDYDAWDGYQANRNRTFQTLYDNEIGNNIMISGDSHANWVSDLVWLDQHAYDPTSGAGAVGVEFAGTGKSSLPHLCPSYPHVSARCCAVLLSPPSLSSARTKTQAPFLQRYPPPHPMGKTSPSPPA